MKINILILLLLLLGIIVFANESNGINKFQEMARNQIINDIYKSKMTKQYTCDSVVEFSKGSITQQECQAQLKLINKLCATLAKNTIQSLTTENEAKQLVQILVTCPVAKMLGYPYNIVDGVPQIQRPIN